MKIAVISDWFSARMGYAENYLPDALGQLGHDVHLLTSNLQVYATSPDYDLIYRSKLGDRSVAPGTTEMERFTLHRMQSQLGRLGIGIPELGARLRDLAPDIAYCFEVLCPTTTQVARSRKSIGYSLFCESRLHTSIFRPPDGAWAALKWAVKKQALGVGDVLDNVEKYYPVGLDVLANITQYLGVPVARCQLSSLAVPTERFHSHADPGETARCRLRLGFRDHEIVCIYTGRFTPDKDPMMLASAIDALHAQGATQFRGLFVGAGDDAYVAQLSRCRGCVVHPFVDSEELALLYQSSDVGVWPRQESTSQLDAMACGLPLVINNSVRDPVRLGEATLTFVMDDVADLSRRLLELGDSATRRRMGDLAAKRIVSMCSWESLARSRITDFQAARLSPTT